VVSNWARSPPRAALFLVFSALEGPKKQKSEHDVDTYSAVFLGLAVFFFLVRSVLRQRTGSERPLVTDTLFYRLSMIAAVLGVVLYVADKAQWHSAPEAALTPVAAPSYAGNWVMTV
jgi:hypothetical protein